MIQKYGVKLGRVWIAWPKFYWRDIWIGIYIPEWSWLMGKRMQPLYICLIPTVVSYFEITLD